MARSHTEPSRGQFRHDQAFVPESRLAMGRFGRMFRNLPSYEPSEETIQACLERMLDPGAAGELENTDLPAGYTYLGQFIDHDLTFDPVSSLERQNDPNALTSFRSPGLDLDSVYGSGPKDQPYLYADDDPTKMRLGVGEGQADPPEADLPRVRQLDAQGHATGREAIALIGDPRNDENIIVSQLHLAFLQLHNRLVDGITGVDQSVEFGPHLWDANQPFREAQRLARWHYQWVVLTDFLPKIMDPAVYAQLVETATQPGGGPPAREVVNRRFYTPETTPYIPVEWSVGAYRFGHSQIRPTYNLNDIVRDVAIFLENPTEESRLQHLAGGRQLPAFWSVDWRFFFRQPAVDPPEPPTPVPADHWSGPTPPPANPQDQFRFLQPSRRIDTKLAAGLQHLPGAEGGIAALAERNLRRGKSMGLPSGQAVARRLVLTPPADPLLSELPGEAPLWYYVLAEAWIEHGGTRLGTVGSTIVGEVILGQLADDPFSFLRTQPAWQPVIPATVSGGAQAFGIADLLAYAVPEDGRRFARAQP